MQCPLTLVLIHTLMLPNGRMVTFCVVQTGPLTSLSQNFHTSTGSLLRGACSPFCHLALVWTATGELQQPWHDCPKVGLSLCCGSFCKLPHSHRDQIFVNYLSVHYNQNCLRVGHGGDNQQQHILIIVSYPQNLAVYLHKSMVWDGCTSIPSSSNNPPRAGFAGWALCRIEDLCSTPEHPNQSRQWPLACL